MDALSLAAVLDALGKLGALGAAGLVIVALLREWLLPKARLDAVVKIYEERLAYRETKSDERLDEMRKDRDEWKGIALRSMSATERSANVAERATNVAEKVL